MGLMKHSFKLLLLSILFVLTGSEAANAAGTTVSDISENMVQSAANVPGLITGLSYMLALLFGALGIMKMRDHVENPHQTQLKTPLINFFTGGALLALPILYQAMKATIDGGTASPFSPGGSLTGFLSGMIGSLFGTLPLQDFNSVLANIIASIEKVPGLLTAASYLLGLILGVSAILRFKEHVENPQQTQLKEGVVRLLVGGGLFALPAIFNAMYSLIGDSGGGGFLSQLLSLGGILFSTEAQSAGCLATGGGGLGFVICNIVLHSSALPAFLTAVCYAMGLFLGIWGLLKVKDHVINPHQTQIWDAVVRFVAGGALFALPTVIDAAYNTVAALILPHTNTNFNDSNTSAGGLDSMLVGFMTDIFGPLTVVLNWFGYIAGMIFVIIGIMRLLKSMQEGPRGPAGFGTIMTFVIGGTLLSFSPMVTALSMSLFSNPVTFTYANLQYTTGMASDEVAHVHAVISAAIKFMLFLGLVSVMRGLFIMRGVAEGNQQASMMAGVTHLVGGALAVNLGPLLNAVQTTLGLSQYGLNFG